MMKASLTARVPSPLRSAQGRILVAFGLLTLLFGLIVALSLVLFVRHERTSNEADIHSEAALMLKDARLQGRALYSYLLTYSVTRDPQQLTDVQEAEDGAVRSVLAARALLQEAGDEGALQELDAFLLDSARFQLAMDAMLKADAAGETLAPEALVSAIAGSFDETRVTFDRLTETERAHAAALQSDADRDGNIALALLALAGAAGGTLAIGASYLTGRSILRPLRGLEDTAHRVAAGDLGARAPSTGVTEFAHLGEVMNEMVSRVQQREQELVLSNEELRERNRQLIEARTVAATDPVTGIPNHRRFQERIRTEIASADRARSTLSLLLLDIDRFKFINDTFGHLEGDRILRELGMLLATVESADQAFRYGGDEFAVLLPGRTLSEACSVAETVRKRAQSIVLGDGAPLTVSLGVSSFPETARSPDELIYGADSAMYRAKAGGKDRVERSEGIGSTTQRH